MKPWPQGCCVRKGDTGETHGEKHMTQAPYGLVESAGKPEKHRAKVVREGLTKRVARGGGVQL